LNDLDLPEADVDLQRLAEICTEFGISELAAFGSRLSGTATESSDLDLLYEFKPECQVGWEIGTLQDQLSDVFGVPVDLVSKRYLHRLLRDRILSEARIIYAA